MAKKKMDESDIRRLTIDRYQAVMEAKISAKELAPYFGWTVAGFTKSHAARLWALDHFAPDKRKTIEKVIKFNTPPSETSRYASERQSKAYEKALKAFENRNK